MIIPSQGKLTKDYLPSIGVGYVAASLERANFEASIIDSHAENLSDEETIEMAIKEGPDAVGINATSHNRFHAIAVARGIKRKSNGQIFVCVGGCHFSSTAQSILESVPEIDAVVRQEGEETFPELLNHYFSKKPFDDVLGITFRKNGGIVSNPPRPFIKNLDGLPLPAWHLFKLDKYEAKLEGEKNTKSIGIMSSRGCPNVCSFCASSNFWQRMLRRRSPEKFVDEIEFLNKKYGYRGFDFWDDTMTMVREHIQKICQEILKRKLDIVWYGRARVNTVDKEILALMRRAGCIAINFGVESGSPRILKNIQKNITLEQVKKVVKTCVDLDYIIKLCFMYSLPGETLEDVRKTRDLMRELKFYGPNVDVISAFTLIYPGTELEANAKRDGILPQDFNWSTPVEFPLNIKVEADPIIPLYEQKELKSGEIWDYLTSARTRRMELVKSIPLAINGIRNFEDLKYLLRRGIHYFERRYIKHTKHI